MGSRGFRRVAGTVFRPLLRILRPNRPTKGMRSSVPKFKAGLFERMKCTLALFFWAFALLTAKAADPAPTSSVSNVTFSQRPDGSKLVDVRYTLTGGSSGIALAMLLTGCASDLPLNLGAGGFQRSASIGAVRAAT